MTLSGNFEFQTEIKNSCEIFLDIFGAKKEELIKISPHRVPSIQLLKGEWGATGCVILVSYLIDGKPMTSRENVEAVDKKKKSITYNLFEGDLMKLYNTLKITVQGCDNHDGVGSNFLKWNMEYEKVNRDVPPPFVLQEFISQVVVEIDAHYLKNV